MLGSRLGASPGHAALDAETMAMVPCAEPFPAFPLDMKQGFTGFGVVPFSIR